MECDGVEPEHPSEGGATPLVGNSHASAEDFLRGFAERMPRTWVIWSIFALNLIVFGLMVGAGVSSIEPTGEDLMSWGADFGPLSVGSEWWRLLTSTFVHIGALHLALNMWFLLKTGALVERIYGHWAFLAVYFFSGLTGSLISVAFDPEIVSAGASGALFGVAGAFLAFLWTHHGDLPRGIGRTLRRSWYGFLLYNLGYGFVDPLINNAAHLGGLAGGIAAGLLLRGSVGLREAPRPVRPLTVLVLLLVLLLGFFTARARVHHAGFGRAWALSERAERALDEDRSEEAAQVCTEALELEPDWIYLRGLRGFAYRRLEQYERALEDFEAAVREYPEDPDYRAALHSVKGEIAFREEHWGDAVAEFNLSLEARPSGIYQARKAWALVELEEYAPAIEQFDRALAEFPDWTWALAGRGTARAGLKDHAGASEDYREVLRIEPEDAWTRIQLARTLDSLEDFEGSAREIEAALSRSPDYARAYVERGRLEWRRKDFEAALEDVGRALDLEPNLAWAYLWRGYLRLYKGLTDKAAEDFRHVIELGEGGGYAHIDLGLIAHLDLELEEALDHYQRAVMAEPELAYAFALQGLAYHDLGDWQQSETMLLRALDPKEENEDEIQLYLWIDRMRLGRRNLADVGLARYLEERKPDLRADWFPELADFLLGRRAEEPSFDGLEWPYESKQDAARTTALFCAGLRDYLAGEVDAARAALGEAVELRALHSFALYSSIALLARLE